ncbi:MAG: ABC transporter ATP-binding protein [Firmicutes bacterium]|nr:ABC transporter ATP-binding protein [Bacillota bacterium]
METLVEVSGLSKRYPGSSEWALRDVSVAFRRGEVYGLVGQNGAGKTTLLRLILGLLRPTSGKIGFQQGVRIGYVPERPAFYTSFTVREYLNLTGRSMGIGGRNLAGQVDEVLATVDLVGKANARIGTLSRGMLQRLGIAQAVLGDSDFIIMDEPAAGLDPLGQRGIRELIVNINRRRKTILFSSHYLAEIERVCHRVGIIHRGRLVLDRNLDDLVREYRGKFEIETDAEPRTLERELLGFGFQFESDGRRVRFQNMDDDRYFALMRLLHDRGIRLLGLRHSALLLEDTFLSVTGSRGDEE